VRIGSVPQLSALADASSIGQKVIPAALTVVA
jgi:hypothetical protein